MAERLAITWAGARDGLWDWNLAAGELSPSPRFEAILGQPAGTLGSDPEEWFRRVHPEDVEKLRSAVAGHLAGAEPRLACEFRLRHSNGSWRWVECQGLATDDGTLLGGSLTDITEARLNEERLLHEFFHDGLTGLPNRTLFLDRLGQALSRRRRRPGPPLGVLYLDLDRFHNINDSLGPAAGDQLLLEVTGRLRGLLRAGDTLARLGGDKFAFLLDGVSTPREAVRIAEAVGAELARSHTLDGHEVFPTASIGIALSGGHSARAEDLLRDAIGAMHRAKEDGAVRYELFDPEMNARAKERLRLEADLYHAIRRGEFLLHYQPIISFQTGELAAFEALVRWKHPERGLIAPDLFVPVAEETGLIVPLGKWVLEEACRQMRTWRTRFPERDDVAVAVNLSARQFEDPNLIDEVSSCLERTRLPADGLELEMTESVVMARTHENASTLQALRDLGIRLLIDDFGTGYSSLASLHSFSLDTLKIDRSFVNGMEFEDEKAEIVRTILTLAKKLDLDVVAEGVETSRQLTMLRELECTLGQGYYFSSAIDGESAGAWIEHSPRW